MYDPTVGERRADADDVAVHGVSDMIMRADGGHTHSGLSGPLVHGHVVGADRVEHAHDRYGWARFRPYRDESRS
jgi:hypothetical protein